MNIHFAWWPGSIRLHPSDDKAPLIRSAQVRSSQAIPDNLKEFGATLARSAPERFAELNRLDPAARTRENAHRIRATLRELNTAQQQGDSMTPAARWLHENAHVIEDTISSVLRDLPSTFYRQLPQLNGGEGERRSRAARTLAIAWQYVAYTDSAVTEKAFTTLVEGFQSVKPLDIAELWALPSLLRFVLLENLRRVADNVRHGQAMREAADIAADRLAVAQPGNEAAILAEYAGQATDGSFATRFLHCMRKGPVNAHEGLVWLENSLRTTGNDARQTAIDEHARLSACGLTTANIFGSLRLIDDIDWTLWFEQISAVDRLLRARTDFAALDFASRDAYRRAIETLARGSGQDEHAVAQQAIELAETQTKDISPGSVDAGCYLVGPGRERFEKLLGYSPSPGERLHRAWYNSKWLGMALPVGFLALLLLIAASLPATAAYGAAGAAFLLVLFIVPAAGAAAGLFNALVSSFVSPHRLIGYEYKNGVPEDARTFVVVPILISSRDDVEQAVSDLEIHYLTNASGALHFALLSDWCDSDAAETVMDRALLTFAREQIATLNRRYPVIGAAPRFYFLHRNRLYNAAEGCWMGWERKRGKLQEFNTLLRGDGVTTFMMPDNPLPAGVQYVMTLDADTRTSRDVVARLVGKLAHPLNRPVFDVECRRVVSGYGVLQPRVTLALAATGRATLFQHIFCASRGIDPYVLATSDVYQDLFGEGIFTGKGLYHVDTMRAALNGRIPDNSVLSHDLLEGAYAHTALVTDVDVIEDYPSRYLTDASRIHRWVRGDWQLLPWLLNPGSGVPGLSRWQMIDNLRRSISPIMWVAASVAGWTALPAGPASQWQCLLILCLLLPHVLCLLDILPPRDKRTTPDSHFAAFARDVSLAVTQVAAQVILMAHDAWLKGDAILRALYRMLLSHRQRLEWRTSSHQARMRAPGLTGHFRAMAGTLPVAIAGLAIPLAFGGSGAVVAVPFVALWSLSPLFAWWISQPRKPESRVRVRPADLAALRRVARRTWFYFETFVTAEHNMLPPDNFQDDPEPVVAGRTSPTNIGLYLLSVISARDFGWIGLVETVDRLEQTLASMHRMQRYSGHLYNWYDTQSLEPLQPLYISSVDSGNLAGHLVAAAAACNQWAEALAVHLPGDLEGIVDAVEILRETLDDLPDDRTSLRPLRKRLADRLDGMHRAVDKLREDPGLASIRSANLSELAADIDNMAKALHEEIRSSASEELVLWAQNLEKTCGAHLDDAHIVPSTLDPLRQRLFNLKEGLRRFAFEMDFRFLMRPERKLLSIGYRVQEGQLDESCYDLLASEARLTSLFGIAKGDLPARHWLRLGRSMTAIGYSGALMSWSGSMFEYLMPPLVMKEPMGGILHQTNRLVVARQISYAHERDVPWGISESAYYARDRELNYQYMTFGVPGLGLKRGLAQDTVIAPYACLLAAPLRPAEVVANLNRLKKLGALGRYGFNDAVDFTPLRLPKGEAYAVVHNFMAHHHGMSIVAVANVAFDGRMRDRFHSDPAIKAAELLLQEKAPRTVPALPVHVETNDRAKPEPLEERTDSRAIPDPLTASPAVSVMSNGRYALMLTATGTGYSRVGDIAVTRWNADPVEERTGTFLFVTDSATGEWWSTTAEPKRAPNESCHTIFEGDRAVFSKTVGTLRSEVECIVMSEHDGEARRLTLWNDGNEDRHIEVTSFAELALAPEAADAAHPAFSKMFVHTDIDGNGATIFAHRRKREHDEPGTVLAHCVTSDTGTIRGAGTVGMVEAETDRRAFIGRGRTIANAAAFDRGALLSGGAGFTLDPVMALRVKVRIPACKKVSLVFWTITGDNRTEVEINARRFAQPDSFQQQTILTRMRVQLQARHIGLSLAETTGVQKLARYLLYPHPALRAPADIRAESLGRQSELWSLAISGDYPIVTLQIGDISELDIVASALRMQKYLYQRGLVFDLAVINDQASSYVQDLQQAIEQLCESAQLVDEKTMSRRQHTFALRRGLMDTRVCQTLMAAACVVLHSSKGPIADQIAQIEASLARRKQIRPAAGSPVSGGVEPAPVSGDNLLFWNGFGGFSDSDHDYVVRLSGQRVTPHPWINVIANRDFGFHVSSEGAAFTWSCNSRDFQLTPWSNDPVTNRPGEGLYIHDRDTGASFSPLACIVRDPAAEYEARHARGVSTFTTRHGDITAALTQLVDPVDPVRLQRLTLRNTGTKARRFRIYVYAEWVLSNSRLRSAPFIITGHDAVTGAITARNPYHLEFGNVTTFLACEGGNRSFTCDRGEFLGRGGSTVAPHAVLGGLELSNSATAGDDACAALAVDVDVAPGEETAIRIVMGAADKPRQVRSLVKAHLAADFEARLVANQAAWRDFAGALQVQTPDPAFDVMMNVWLPYQALACRIRARSAFYQASGAYGFRDQLQDTLSLLLHDPSLARGQILNAASRQFPQGDVQHWWLPLSGAGVRTRISDDVVWLAHATHHYMKTTGDRSILNEELPFISGPELEKGRADAFFTPGLTTESASLYEHCARALDLAIIRTGDDGIPLILGGDWNDGMNRVGEDGKGTSTWLGWFLLATLRDFAPVAMQRGDTQRAEAWMEHARRLGTALQACCWDGEWYRRGTYDDGTPLGSRLSDECRIDSIAQSWAVLSGMDDPQRARQAVGKAVEILVEDELKVVRLFTPPFDHTEKNPGYIKSYPPGVRENGGQYTHAATWLAAALAEVGHVDEAYRIFSMLNPVNHALDERAAVRYRVEPYVVAADIYSEDSRAGRGGWTWYTGSAGWLYRVAVEHILGIVREGETLRLKPAIPTVWNGFTASLRINGAHYRITVKRGLTPGLMIDGVPATNGVVPLASEGQHEIELTLASN
ncbi:GH36-type glycosyl hydrolase domain-containing protein [Pseudochelatococcus contaminans]|uniref:GH36-type glycosyl hydrolase domain-containing protein n=1 Tax=Pseudochelatococcus contaminans TaxID=1538103 RepID=UPI00161EA2ED|nr:glucoamylase family protein [Pseudochelatococcus contaminans]